MPEIEVSPQPVERPEEILTAAALAFLAELHERFGARRNQLLKQRHEQREQVARTGWLDFDERTAGIRQADWTVAPAPADLLDRRVEITGPTEKKMTVNALNSQANVWLADLEDANTPHWENVVGGQVNLYDAIRRQVDFTAEDGKEYRLRTDKPLATVVMRPRGWHLDEVHIRVDGRPTAGALIDFGLYFFHNATELLVRGSGPYFYLPKLESHLEARLWDEVFSFAEERLGIAHGTIRATVLIETIPAAFCMEEILYELRDHACGLNAGRWDYLFSVIKYFRDAGADFVLPDRNAVGMTAPFMRAYTDLLVRTCHKRGAHAIGGMAAFIPSRKDAEVNRVAFAKVTEDKEREASQGFDGSWVAHPDLVPVCADVFDRVLGDAPHQIERTRDDVHVRSADLLDVASTPGKITETGLRNNVEVALVYLASWLRGTGAVGIHNLMEDAATAEISRSQIWQWVHHGCSLVDGTTVTDALARRIVAEELASIRETVGEEAFEAGKFTEASELFEQVAVADEYVDFLTLPAYDAIA